MSIEKENMPRHNVRGLETSKAQQMRRGDRIQSQPGDLSVYIMSKRFFILLHVSKPWHNETVWHPLMSLLITKPVNRHTR